MHFWVSATRGDFHGGVCWPRKIGTNWFIPAFVNSRFGASGKSDEEGTMVCPFSRKKSRNDWRICAEVMMSMLASTNRPAFAKLRRGRQEWKNSTRELANREIEPQKLWSPRGALISA